MRSDRIIPRLVNRRSHDEEIAPMRGRTTGTFGDGVGDQSLMGEVIK